MSCFGLIFKPCCAFLNIEHGKFSNCLFLSLASFMDEARGMSKLRVVNKLFKRRTFPRKILNNNKPNLQLSELQFLEATPKLKVESDVHSSSKLIIFCWLCHSRTLSIKLSPLQVLNFHIKISGRNRLEIPSKESRKVDFVLNKGSYRHRRR